MQPGDWSASGTPKSVKSLEQMSQGSPRPAANDASPEDQWNQMQPRNVLTAWGNTLRGEAAAMHRRRFQLVILIFSLVMAACQPGAGGQVPLAQEAPAATRDRPALVTPASRTSPESMSPTATVPAATRAVALRPLPGKSVAGQVERTPLPSGDLRLTVDAQAPPNLLWFVVTGDCAVWTDASPQAVISRMLRGLTVLGRFNQGSDLAGHWRFSVLVPSNDAAGPLAMVPFVEGGGPPLACADVGTPTTPSAAAPTPTPAAGSTWRALRRAVPLPRLLADGSCRQEPIRADVPGYSTATGPGPVYVAGQLTDFTVDHAFRTAVNSDGWARYKMMWLARPEYRGQILIRAWQIDGANPVRFQGPGATIDGTELHLTWENSGRIGTLPDWGNWGGYTEVRAPGCYLWQVDGLDFSYAIVFEVPD